MKNTNKFSLITISLLIIALISSMIFFRNIIISGYEGESMLPTLKKEGLILLSRSNSIDRFDLITFEQDEINLLKRVIALPGERIDIINEKIYINNKLVTEPFETIPYASGCIYNKNISFEDIMNLSDLNGTVIPEDYYFVLGDNRHNSHDSRAFGLIHKSQINYEGVLLLYSLD